MREATIARLERPYLGRPPLLDAAAAARERELLAWCDGAKAVGRMEYGTPVTYPYLCRPLPMPARHRSAVIDWTESQWAELEELVERTSSIHLRLQGWAGYLLTEPSFLAERDRVRALWRGLPAEIRPHLPLGRPPRMMMPAVEALEARLPAAVGGFFEALEALLDRWGLVRLATWHLPEPQGPQTFAMLPPGSPAMPRHAIHIVLPIHYPLAGDEDLLARIRAEQRARAEAVGLERHAAGLPHHKAYARIFEIVHWEAAISRRFPEAVWRKGFVGHMVEAVAETIGIEATQVAKWRKAIKACLRGNRQRLKALRVDE